MMQTSNPINRTGRQHGFSMIEVLIAILVLAIGLLGMAHMQASGMRSTHGAYIRTQATVLAGSIIDSMRANATAARSGNYDVAFGGTGTAGTIEGDDLITWKNDLGALLPGGDGQITTTGSDVTVEISWTGLRQQETAGNAANKVFTVDTTI